MLPWMMYYRQGLRRLARHEPHLALKSFHAAVSACPVTRVSHLARILFYTGVTLKKMGVHDGAVRTWSISQKLVKAGPVLHYMKWFSNEYGMARQDFADMDDWRAFYTLQLKRYLKLKKSHCLENLAEGDMVRDLIYDAWITLKNSGDLGGKSLEEKMAAFQGALIVFPFFPCGSLQETSHPMSGAALLDFSCPCGSGQPFLACCGHNDYPLGHLTEAF
ncbi:MAG: hypothetical protein LBT68_07750 [Spirochaetales bacterium]|jgi:hypothetical protein|nr:hypothetical protein [Spirochaetales bacterium]